MLVLATPTNPGQASWVSMPQGNPIFSATTPGGTSTSVATNLMTALTDAAVTIPANTVQPGDLILYSFSWYFDLVTNAAPALSIQLGIRTDSILPWDWTTLDTITLAASSESRGGTMCQPLIADGFNPNSALGTAVTTVTTIPPTAPASVSSSTYIFGAFAADYTQPIVVTPIFQATAANPGALVSAFLATLQVIRP